MGQAVYESISTRTTLLERLKDWRDDSSWREFFNIYWKLIYGFALRNGLTEVEAQDVVQETMLSVAKQMPNFKYDRKTGSFKQWLLTMTRWRIVDQMRKRERLAVMPEDPRDMETQTRLMDRMPDPNSLNPGAVWEAEWEKSLFDAALAKVKRDLDPEKYQIFDFLVNKHWPAEKVAKNFHISIDQVYLAKHRVTFLIKNEVKRLNKDSF